MIKYTAAQKKTKPFVDEIYKQYLENHPEGINGEDEAIKSYLHSIILSVSRTMSTLGDPDYKRAFNLLSEVNRKQFYKEMFSIGSQNASYFESRSLPCCLIKDSYDGDFAKIKQGGFAGEILISIARANKENPQHSSILAKEWGIDHKIAKNLYERGVNIIMASQMSISSVENLSFPDKFNSELLGSLFRKTLPKIEREFRAVLGMDGILKNSILDKEEDWTEKLAKSVSFVGAAK